MFYVSARIAPDTVLRLQFEGGLSCREIVTSQAISYGTVANYLRLAQKSLAELASAIGHGSINTPLLGVV